MTHFNHDWDTTKTPAVPVSTGDRYYAQDLNDDFNYLKHLPYEVFLQGRSRGVMVTPNDTWDNDTNSLTLSGGFGVVLQDCIELDPNEDFVIPPKTHSSPRYERIPFTDVTLVLPNDGAVHYIVATPTKRSLLQRTKALFTDQYASRVRYDGVITIQDTAPTTGQILVGLCHDKEYCLLTDANPNQCRDNVILKKWFGQDGLKGDFVSALQPYYNTNITSIETKILIDMVESINVGINGGIFSGCDITIDTLKDNGVSIRGIGNGIFNNCTIKIARTSTSISNGVFNNCMIKFDETDIGTSGGTFNNCDIDIDTIYGNGIDGGTFSNCTINIGTVGNGSGISDGTLNNCVITIDTITTYGILGGTFNNCTIKINRVDNGVGVGSSSIGINGGIFSGCDIEINTISSGTGIYINRFTADGFNNCTIYIATVEDSCYGIGFGVYNGYTFNGCTIRIDIIMNGIGIKNGVFNNCNIIIIDTDNIAIENSTGVTLYFTRIQYPALTNLNSTDGKLNILNKTIFHAS